MTPTSGFRSPKNVFDGAPPSRAAHAAIASVDSAGDPRLPMVGIIPCRDSKGRRISVDVRDTGFEYDGKPYKSLSSNAREVTGTKWNGFDFFGLVLSQEAAVAQR